MSVTCRRRDTCSERPASQQRAPALTPDLVASAGRDEHFVERDDAVMHVAGASAGKGCTAHAMMGCRGQHSGEGRHRAGCRPETRGQQESAFMHAVAC